MMRSSSCAHQQLSPHSGSNSKQGSAEPQQRQQQQQQVLLHLSATGRLFV
jgi:hypothetical protein